MITLDFKQIIKYFVYTSDINVYSTLKSHFDLKYNDCSALNIAEQFKIAILQIPSDFVQLGI